jgi:hypothetical protein
MTSISEELLEATSWEVNALRGILGFLDKDAQEWREKLTWYSCDKNSPVGSENLVLVREAAGKPALDFINNVRSLNAKYGDSSPIRQAVLDGAGQYTITGIILSILVVRITNYKIQHC